MDLIRLKRGHRRTRWGVIPLIEAAILLSWLVTPGGIARAAAPANDTCAGAVVIPSTSFPYLTAVVPNMNEATLSGDPVPNPDCITGAARGIWYRFTPNQTGKYSFSTGADTATTAFDTILAIYASTGCGTPLTEIACNDDSGAGNNRAGLLVDLVSGTGYFVLVWLSQADDGAPGSLALQLRVDRPVAPANDTCATAVTIPADRGFPQRSPVVDTTLANTESPLPSCIDAFRSVWYKFTPTNSGSYILSVGPETGTTVFDPVMVLYSSASGCGGLVELSSGCVTNRNGVLRTLTGGTTYYIAIHDQSFDGVVSETMVQLSIATPTAPSVVTLPVVSISSTGAVVSGVVNPNGLQSRFWVEWGPTTAYTSTSPVPGRLLFAAITNVTTNVVLTGISPNVTYHYRFVATNSSGRVNGLDDTFVWRNARPTLVNPERLLSGSFRFSFSGFSKQLYVIESSTNLVDWTWLGEAAETQPGSGTFIYSHPGLGISARRFYRVFSP